jgi:NRPS condensation-like uncharacterized protein
VRDAFQIEVPLRKLFELPTLASLAEDIDAALRANLKLEEPPITRVPRREYMPLSYAQERLWFLDQLEPNSPAYVIPAALRLTGSLDVPALGKTFNEIVRRHETLRTTFAILDGQPSQLIAPERIHQLQVDDLTHLAEGEREAQARQVATEEAHRPFDLARGPLLRTRLLRMGEREHVLVMSMHHIISDGWSMGVIVKEVAALYEAYSRGDESPLEELEIQ